MCSSEVRLHYNCKTCMFHVLESEYETQVECSKIELQYGTQGVECSVALSHTVVLEGDLGHGVLPHVEQRGHFLSALTVSCWQDVLVW